MRRKLTEKDAQEILDLRRGGMKTLELAEIFGVTGGTISHIVTGRTWKHLDRTGIKSRAPSAADEKPEPTPAPPPEPEPEPEPEPPPPPPPPPPPKPKPKAARNPKKKYCEKCDRVMKVENTSNARYTVFVLWSCVCGFQTLEKRHPGAPKRAPEPNFFEEEPRAETEEADWELP
jgi:hypothetical protein